MNLMKKRMLILSLTAILLASTYNIIEIYKLMFGKPKRAHVTQERATVAPERVTSLHFEKRFNISTGVTHGGAVRVKVLYIESKVSPEITQKIEAMHDALRDDLVVIWDNKNVPECPYLSVHCVSYQNVTRSQEWSQTWTVGLGQEKAMMWAMEHAAEFDYVWTLESDVHFTSIDTLKQIVYSNSTSDSLTQEAGMDCGDEGDRWFWRTYFKMRWGQTGLPPLCFHALHSFFRMSHLLLARLEEVRQLNNGNWMFYEAMIPTTVRLFNLTEELWWMLHDLPQTQWTMRYRPCFVELPVPGIYHPVKFKDGQPIKCNAQSTPARLR